MYKRQDMSAAAPPDAQSAAQPVTAPEFGAAYLHNPAPAYPAAALRQGWEGTVLLKVHVLANGQPDQVLVASTSGHPVLDDAAVEVVTPWRFVPAKSPDGSVIPVRTLFELFFHTN